MLTLELTLLPALHGCWVDLCMLPLFDAVWGDRMAWFRTSPVSFLLVHWVLGMAFLMGIATFLSILRQQLRPGESPVQVLVAFRGLTPVHVRSPTHHLISLPLAGTDVILASCLTALGRL